MVSPYQILAVSAFGAYAAVYLSSRLAAIAPYIPSFWITFSILFFSQIISIASWKIILYPHYFSPLRHLPQPKGASYLNGHFARIFAEPTGAPQREWIQEIPNDGLVRYKALFNSERVIPANPKALADVLVHKNYDFIKPPQIRQGIGRLLGIGVLLAEGDEHKRQRKHLMPAFTFRHIKDLYPIFWAKGRECTDAMWAAAKADANAVVEAGSWASRATLDIIGVAGMGQDFGAIQDPHSELNETYRKVFVPSRAQRWLGLLGIFLPFFIVRRLPLKRNYEIIEASAIVKKTCLNLITAKKAKLEKGERVDPDILSVALESGGFTDDDLVNQMMTFLAAGHETTASAMSWAAYLLCKHPDIQSRLRSEIRERLPALSDSEVTVTAADIDALPYLSAVCNEVLRFIPSVPMTIRVAARDTSIVDQAIPKGTTVFLCPWAINHSKALWGPDAGEFNPDRWMGPGRANTGGAESNYAMLTFLHGPRSCIGQGFAQAEFRCLLAAWVGRFDMRFETEGYEAEIAGGVTVKPKGGLRVKLREVEGW